VPIPGECPSYPPESSGKVTVAVVIKGMVPLPLGMVPLTFRGRVPKQNKLLGQNIICIIYTYKDMSTMKINRTSAVVKLSRIYCRSKTTLNILKKISMYQNHILEALKKVAKRVNKLHFTRRVNRTNGKKKYLINILIRIALTATWQ
jgi:hypothetical protein